MATMAPALVNQFAPPAMHFFTRPGTISHHFSPNSDLFSSLENEIQLQMISEEQNSDDDCDSGNDEPSDYLPLERRASVSGTPQQERAGGEEEAPALTRSQLKQHRELTSLLEACRNIRQSVSKSFTDDKSLPHHFLRVLPIAF